MKLLSFLTFLFLYSFGFSQIEPLNGLEESKPQYYALKNATIYVSPDKKIQHGTLLIKNGKVEKVGLLVSIPSDAVEINMKGRVILPAFVELNSSIGVESPQKVKTDGAPQLVSNKKGAYYWNESIHPEVDANEIYHFDQKKAEELLKKGFGFVLTHQKDGIARGKGAVITLSEQKNLLKGDVDNSFYSFQKGVSKQTYPSSQMGSIALFRQTLYDLEWYKENREQKNISLDALGEQIQGTMFFESREKWEVLRAQKVANEFDFTFNYLGSGDEYEIVDELKEIKGTFVLPLDFPAAYDVENPYMARQIPLSDLKHWEMAPSNPAILQSNGVNICLSSVGVKEANDFWENLRKVVQQGLTEEQALAALTLNPAKLLKQDDLFGSLEEGKMASFVVYDKNPFREQSKVLESWISGEQKIYESLPLHDIRGKYNIQVDGKKYPLEISGELKSLEAEVTYVKLGKKGAEIEQKVKAFVALQDHDVTVQFNIDNHEFKGSIALQGKVSTKFGVFEGDGLLPDGRWSKWSAIKRGNVRSTKDKAEVLEADTTNYTWFPNSSYGFLTQPEMESVVIKNATLWTNEESGIIENGTVVIQNGKITYAGSGSKSVSGARVIDAEGKHVTSGIIDEHSHIAISKGVNESGQAISAEVSIGDVIDPDDIDVYRQLAGGVTTSHLLHGSANPVGGQSALIKLKWGHSAEEMLIDDAPKFIKFALGENVKQANWGDKNTVRFPQTRMGVEQVYHDGFEKAKTYAESWKAYKANNALPKPRVDLELEVLNEILDRERFITCHSYVQSEINMLMKVAEQHGFTINTFTHILEGYKLADKMVEHGAGGSTFSDWWAYKYEVNDAIPYNATMMHNQGVLVAINSDDAEMGRRLNQEAAKSVKYGGMSEEDAWKMVTLNPAKLLHLDDRMGSLKEGKDADVVIWSDNPLSIQAKVEYTIVDGEVLFDKEEDERMRKRDQTERARIISKMLSDNKAGGKKRSFFKKKKGHFHCNTMGEEASHEENHH